MVSRKAARPKGAQAETKNRRKKTRASALGSSPRRVGTGQLPTPDALATDPKTQVELGAGQGRKRESFDPSHLHRSVIAVPLLDEFDKEEKPELHKVVIDVNVKFPGGRDAALEQAKRLIDRLVRRKRGGGRGINRLKSELSDHYLFAELRSDVIKELVRMDREAHSPGEPREKAAPAALHRIWPDFPIEALTHQSISTVKADAARNAFGALGADIVWAVMDSGIDQRHPHFAEYSNLEIAPPLAHRDFTRIGDDETNPEAALIDDAGHGTHVAGIIGGALQREDDVKIIAKRKERDPDGKEHEVDDESLDAIAGMAPRCKLVSLKVLDGRGKGDVSNLIVALEQIQRFNDYGRRLAVHGVNMSVGYSFDPEWFACGQSPLCVEVDRLVRSGVMVVVAAGNTGYGWNQSEARGMVAAGMDLTINDPGNAELAITVGATHRDQPHRYGVSYFSSKGPTGDGRPKPDLVAPGEKILSCRSGRGSSVPAGGERSVGAADASANMTVGFYLEMSGTSMAAPHVSGVIAAFLSVRREFIGRPERVKEIFMATATDLRRDRYFQGSGLVDLMRAIQSV